MNTQISIKKMIMFLIIALFAASFFWGLFKPLPQGINAASNIIQVTDADIKFLFDLTDNTGIDRQINQQIFANVFELIDQAQEFIVIDMFLFMHDEIANNPIPLSLDFKNKLLAKRQANPDVPIYFITDEFNTFYRSNENPLIQELSQAGVKFIYTDLDKLRDPNPAISAITRLVVKPFGPPNYDGGFIPNFLGEGKVSLRSIFKMLDFKANHRKLIVTESEAMLMSANPHTGSSLHSNVGVRVKSSALIQSILKSEKSVAQFSGSNIPLSISTQPSEGDINLQFVTENAIEVAVLEAINSAKPTDKVNIGMFYFSNRKIVEAIKQASARGVDFTLLLDANKDAFGREKNGIPNRQVAFELAQIGVKIYWYDTQGEQFHTKILIKETAMRTVVILGSGNYTKRNLGNYNLEADLVIDAPMNSQLSLEVRGYFEEALSHSLGFVHFMEPSQTKQLLYRFQEWSGLSTF